MSWTASNARSVSDSVELLAAETEVAMSRYRAGCSRWIAPMTAREYRRRRIPRRSSTPQ